jgi:hypothetical protein
MAHEWNLLGACAMSSAADKEFETYARDCVKLAKQDNTPPELRDRLLKMAREWMHAAMDQEDGTDTPRRSNAPYNA